MLIISHKVSNAVKKMFETACENILYLQDNPNLQSKIAFHTDLSCVFIEDTLICCPSMFQFFKSNLPSYINLKKGLIEPGVIYPQDVAYNAAHIGKFLFCKTDYTEPEILKTAKEKGIKIIEIKQAYAKCSIIKVTDTSIITADTDIYKKAMENGINALLTTNKGVFLTGFNNGFIGGTSVKINNILYFTGDISKHEDFQKIKYFCENQGVKINFIKNEILFDYGSPIFIS